MKLKYRSEFWLTRFLNWFGGSRFWTTIGDTVYVPDDVDDPLHPRYSNILEHEQVHIDQQERYGTVWFLFLYGLVFFPVFFAYFRWKFEREAYMVNIRKGQSIDAIVDSLWSGYLWTWPKCWMRKWFIEELGKEQ